MMDFVADIGTAWLGRLDIARRLIESAKSAGATVIKPQWWPSSDYKGHPLEREALRCLMSPKTAWDLVDICSDVGINVQFSVWEKESVEQLISMGVWSFKIACSKNRDLELIRHILGSKAKLLCISCENYEVPVLYEKAGMLDIHHQGVPVRIYYCVPQYPTKFHQLCFPRFNEQEGWPEFDGFSDHTLGWEAAMIAVARGATIIEKHLRLTAEEYREEFGVQFAHFPDELCAVDPATFAVMVSKCLEVEKII